METKDLINEINTSITEIKSAIANGATKAEIEAMKADVETKFADVGGLRDRLDEIETKMNRPTVPTANPMETERKSLDAYLRSGDKALIPEGREYKAMSTTEADGGYTIVPEMSNEIIVDLRTVNPIRQYANVFTVGTGTYEIPTHDGDIETGWSGEADERTETDTGVFGLKSIAVKEQYAMPKTSNKLLRDSAFNMEGWLRGQLSEAFGASEATKFILGDGVKEPQGLILSTNGVTRIDSATASVIGADDITGLYFALAQAYRSNAVWLMNGNTLKAICDLVDDDGNRLVVRDLTTGAPTTLLGRPIVECDSMPDIADSANAIVFGDLRKAYWIADQEAFGILADPYTEKGFVKYYTTKFTGAGVVKPEAMRILKIKAVTPPTGG